MGGVITSILTDQMVRDASSVETALMVSADIAAPWGNAPEA